MATPSRRRNDKGARGVVACLKTRGGIAKTITSHYWKECYNTLAHHVAGNFVLESYEALEKTRQPHLEGRLEQPVEHHRPLAVGELVLRLTALEHMEDLRNCAHDNNED